jgi:7,8-dihydropterin-6-yl-methyl-4-(beta-D-ribofuranosyl)aminobenzene 5'-phosphate synthase
MRIVSLVEDTTVRADCIPAPGLSLYVETEKHKLLFDLGPDETFLANAQTLGVDVAAVDAAFVSHGHDDHGGGMDAFLAHNACAPVYVQRHAFGDIGALEDGVYLFAGLDATLKNHPRAVLCEGARRIDDELFLFSDIEEQFDSRGNRLLATRSEGLLHQDDFRHEQCLVVGGHGKNVLFSGCSHRGIANIMRKAIAHCGRIDVCVGGFHLFDPVGNRPERDELLGALADELSGFGTVFYTCHCTGVPVYERMKARMGERLHYLSTGCELTL